ncbi:MULTISPECIES: nuclease-related domain-containing protein [Aeromonas]|uniref:nuclease-related domain-containing protein n=1 Tax=Aeromonas TaxID=642 RepID=UPI0021D86508|nr:nuclease-related domain-containing protein [Aeromonas veronii]UYB71080.1 NERD domain-containing protein [Aeromonas veronii]
MQGQERQCQEFYQTRFAGYAQQLAPFAALDECLHDFLDQRPSGKYTTRNRAAGLAAASFWWEPVNLEGAQLASLALGRILHFEDAISTALLDHLAARHPDVLRWAIRYSKLFTRSDSPLWRHLRDNLVSKDWCEFFGVCDRLLEQLEPFDKAIALAESHLKSLSLLELLSYLSVTAYGQLGAAKDRDSSAEDWDVYDRIIARKLLNCSERDFQLTEEVLGRSLKRHLSPLLFPQSCVGRECVANLESVALLIAAMRERIDYENSINWFCFDSDCGYQLKPGQPVIFNKTDLGSQRWQRTERKSRLLWHYWMYRAIEQFAASDMAGAIIGRPENHEANQLAYIKAIRSQLYLQTIFGLGERVRLNDGAEVALHHAILASELTTVFFEQAFLQPFLRYMDDSGVAVKALGQLAFEGLVHGENRFPITWSEPKDKIRRICGWTVSPEHPKGDPEAAEAILKFWTSDLQALSAQIRQAPSIPSPRLYERPFYKIGRYSFQFPWVAGQQNNLTAAVNNLRRVEQRRPALRSETERIEHTLAEVLRQRGFHVVVGYQPPLSDERDAGEVDLICHLDGVALLLEVKSGFIRSTRHEVWLHRTNTLRKAARQLKRKQPVVLQALQNDQGLRSALLLSDVNPLPALHAWVVDTSIEFDGEVVDGFHVVSREIMEIALRDEPHYLREFEEMDEAEAGNEVETLYADGFSAQALVRLIESDGVWSDLL